MGKLVGAVALCCLFVVLSVTVLVSAVFGGAPPASGPSDSGPGPSPSGLDCSPALPAGWAQMDQAAAATCPGLPWMVLAAIGTVESGSGQSTEPGVSSGANSAGTEGPMQFEPETSAAHATVGPGGARPASPYDAVDAVYTAAALLCADGGGSSGGLRGAVLAYNHDTTYADTVLTLAVAFGDDPSVDGTVVVALSFAAGRLGTPYLWGGSGAGRFDCSGLSLAAFAQGGVVRPRVAQDQFAAGPPVPDGTSVRPGGLIFFGTGPAGVDHVGIYVGSGFLIDAPHSGAVVRVESADWSGLVGATRPG